jgi:hypothetical protein
MTGNATFPTPNPTLATFQADIEALNTAETAVLARTKGAADTRNAKLAVVKADLQSLIGSDWPPRWSPSPPLLRSP